MVILGIDPGTTRIGYGVIEKNNGLKLVDYGVIEIRSGDQKSKLLKLSQELRKLIKKYKPVEAGIEKLYFSKNQKTALAVAEARGVIMLTLAEAGLPISEFGPNEIKSAVAGYGASDKEAVRKMVALTLKMSEVRGLDDASDALAIAIRTSFKLAVKPIH